jgi:hypothetical protein
MSAAGLSVEEMLYRATPTIAWPVGGSTYHVTWLSVSGRDKPVIGSDGESAPNHAGVVA